MSAKRPALLNAVVPDQWADLTAVSPERLTGVPAGWDSAESFSARTKWSVRSANAKLKKWADQGKAERKKVHVEGFQNSFYIYRRIPASGKVA